MIMPKETLLGVKIPSNLKTKISDYCDRNGIKIKAFVAQAIQEKLLMITEEMEDNKAVDERLEHSEFLSENEMEKYFKKRQKSG